MDAPTPAPAPDPVATANAQTASNRATATTQFGLDATNQNTPQGSLKYNQIGTWSDGTPRFEANTTLNPQEQSIYSTNAQTRQNVGQIGQDQSSRIASLLGTPFSFQGLPSSVSNVQGGPIQSSIKSAGPINSTIANAGPIQTSIGGDTSGDRQKVEDAIYSRLNPQLDRDTSALQTKLINQGIRPGSVQYQNAIDADNRGRNDARMQAVLAGGQEQTREFAIDQGKGQFTNSAQGQQFTQNAADLAAQQAAQGQQYTQNANDAGFANSAQAQQFGQGATNANLNNASRAAGIGEQSLLRETPINEISALMSGSQVSQPGFTSTPQPGVAPTDVIGAQQQSLNQSNVGFQAQQQQNQALMSGLFGLGSAGLGGWAYGGFKGSDRRTKENISKVGTLDNGLPVYKYNYKGAGLMEIGLMAQDVAQERPDAIATTPEGFMAVDYDRATEAA